MAVESISPTRTHYTDRVAKAAHQAVDRAALRSGRAEARLRRDGERYSDQSRQTMDRMSTYMYDHPYTSIGVALAGGYLIARMLRRR